MLYNSQWSAEGDLEEMAQLVNGILDSTVHSSKRLSYTPLIKPRQQQLQPQQTKPTTTAEDNGGSVGTVGIDGGSVGTVGTTTVRSGGSRGASDSNNTGEPALPESQQPTLRNGSSSSGTGTKSSPSTAKDLSGPAKTSSGSMPRLHPSFRLWFVVSSPSTPLHRHRIPRALWNPSFKLTWQSTATRRR